MPKALLFILLLLATVPGESWKLDKAVIRTALPKPDYVAFKPGEKLEFILHYGKINAGKAQLEVKDEVKQIAGRDHFDVVIRGTSLKTFDNLYKVRDYYESFIDAESLLPTVFLRDISEGPYEKKEHYIFDRRRNLAKSGSNILSVDPQMHDIVSVFYYLRCIDWSQQPVGARTDVVTLFEEQPMPFSIEFKGSKAIETRLGKINCYVFKPKLVKGRIFKNQDDMTIYVSQDKNQIPIRIESHVYLNFVRADITSYSGLKFPFTALVED